MNHSGECVSVPEIAARAPRCARFDQMRRKVREERCSTRPVGAVGGAAWFSPPAGYRSEKKANQSQFQCRKIPKVTPLSIGWNPAAPPDCREPGDWFIIGGLAGSAVTHQEDTLITLQLCCNTDALVLLWLMIHVWKWPSLDTSFLHVPVWTKSVFRWLVCYFLHSTAKTSLSQASAVICPVSCPNMDNSAHF